MAPLGRVDVEELLGVGAQTRCANRAIEVEKKKFAATQALSRRQDIIAAPLVKDGLEFFSSITC